MSVPIGKTLEPLIQRLYEARDALRDAVDGEFAFTLDGNLVGDIGEAIAFRDFGLVRLPSGSAVHDFKTQDGRLVQVKTTQATTNGRGVGLGLAKQSYKHLLVIQIAPDGTYAVLYDGPSTYIDNARSHKKSASLSVSQLRKLNGKVPDSERILGGA